MCGIAGPVGPRARLKIALVVHGRFHAFELTRELIKLGHEVTLFTNFPRNFAERYGVPASRVKTFLAHGIFGRIAWELNQRCFIPYPEAALYRWFGRWAAKELLKRPWDIVHVWSGFCEEPFLALKNKGALLICHRSSSHIRTQARLLLEEKKRTGAKIAGPSTWIVEREVREYDLADLVHVPSTFSKESFLKEGFPNHKIRLILHGVDTRFFRSPFSIMESRVARVLEGKPLRILNIGTFSFRKGAWDWLKIIQSLHSKQFDFRLVGPVEPQASGIVNRLKHSASFFGKKTQKDLLGYYAWADLFVLPTIEDGFPFVLTQAQATGLPILTTPNGAGTDLVEEGITGWVLPIRSPEAFIERLRWCDAHRVQLAGMVRQVYSEFKPRDWSDVARDFVSEGCRR